MSLIKANAHQVGDYTLTNEGGKLVINQGTPDTVLNPVATFGTDGLEVGNKLLSGTSGSSLVGYDGGTVQDVLDAVTGPTGAASVGYTPAGAGAVGTSVQSKLREHDASLANVEGNLNFNTLPTAVTPVDDNDLLLLRQGAGNTKLTVATVRVELAVDAINAATAAQASRLAADAAAEIASASVGIYATSADGIAATTSGQYFWVVATEATYIMNLYLRTAGGATFTGKSSISSAGAESFSMSSGILTGGSATVNTTAQTIAVSGRVTVGARSISVSASFNFSSLSSATTIYVLYDVAAAAVIGLDASGLQVLDWRASQYVYLFTYIPTTRQVQGFAGVYSIDGVEINPNNKGHAQLYSQNAPVAVNTTAKTITFPSGARISSGTSSVTLSSDKVFDYSAETLFSFYLVYSATTQSFSRVTGSSIPSLKPTEFVIGLFDRFYHKFLEGVSQYSVDGVLQDIAGVYSSIASRSTTPILFYTPEQISLDTHAKTLTLSAVYAVTSGGERYFIDATLNWSAYDDATAGQFITYNTETGLLSARPSASLNQWTRKDIFICRMLFRPSRLSDLQRPYTINGKRSDEEAPLMQTSYKNALAFPLDGIFSSDTVPGYRTTDPLPAADITASTLYGWYDALMAANPGYITRELLGNEATGLPLYVYYFKPSLINDVTSDVRPIRIMIQAAIHGLERMSYLYVYHFMRQVCEDWQTNPLLEALRFGVEIAVIPALNPWGVNNGSRNNSSNVDINRNYPVDWASSTDPYKGASPLSEPEAQYSYGLMRSFKPDVFFDCHNFGSDPTNRFMWTESMSTQVKREAAAVTNLMSAKWRKEIPETPSGSGLGFITGNRLGGSAQLQAFTFGFNSRTYETNDGFMFGAAAEDYSATSVKFATESFGNTLIYTLKKNYC